MWEVAAKVGLKYISWKIVTFLWECIGKREFHLKSTQIGPWHLVESLAVSATATLLVSIGLNYYEICQCLFHSCVYKGFATVALWMNNCSTVLLLTPLLPFALIFVLLLHYRLKQTVSSFIFNDAKRMLLRIASDAAKTFGLPVNGCFSYAELHTTNC